MLQFNELLKVNFRMLILRKIEIPTPLRKSLPLKLIGTPCILNKYCMKAYIPMKPFISYLDMMDTMNTM